jgi:phosphoserine phosphatase
MCAETTDWVESVLAQGPRIAVFDCDGTLWAPDSGYGFMRWTQAEGILSRQASEWMDERYRLYLAGSVSEAVICGEMVQVYAGLREDELRHAAERYVSQSVVPMIFPEMRELVERLQAEGAEVWAVSSTNQWVVEAGVTGPFGIPSARVLAARVEMTEDLAGERLLAVPTDAAKADALWKAGVKLPDAVFGNSLHDLAMLEMARLPYPVNPSGALLRHATNAGWQSFWPKGCLVPAAQAVEEPSAPGADLPA